MDQGTVGAYRGGMPTSFTELLDTLSEGALVLDAATGALVHRNRALRTMLDADAAAPMLSEAGCQLAQRWRRLRTVPRPAANGAALLRDVRFATTHAVYRLWCMALQLGHPVPNQTVVLVERMGLPLPPAAHLRTRFRLTARETQVALLLAEGASDADIGRALGMSIHTARHHGERVFTKVGVHSRKALALYLV